MAEHQVAEELVADEPVDDIDDPSIGDELTAEAERALDVERIERLASKIRGLIAVKEQVRAELAQAEKENERLTAENSDLRERLATAEATAAELTTVRAEREKVRSRVEDLLEQLERIDDI